MKKFYVSESILANEIPTLAFTVTIESMKSLDGLTSFVEHEVESLLKQYADVNPNGINSIVGYRQLHEKYGEKSKKIVPAPESLIKLLKKKGSIPRIIPLVDIYNLISIKFALALGAHDLDKVHGNIALKFSAGGEVFIPLGTASPEKIYSNEYGYFDDATDEVLCRLEARQSDKTKTSNQTRSVLLIIQGNTNTNSKYLLDAKRELIHNLSVFFQFNIDGEFDFLGED